MKKILSGLLVVTIAAAMLCVLYGCSASSQNRFIANSPPMMDRAMPQEEPMTGGFGAASVAYEKGVADKLEAADYDVAEDAIDEEADIEEEPMGGEGPESVAGFVPENQRKLIRRSYISAETREFDTAIEELKASMEQFGGFIESSSYRGNGITPTPITPYERGGRGAHFTVRIPETNYDTFLSSISKKLYVVSQSESVEDASTSYYDNKTRLEGYKTQQRRLIELLNLAETVEDMLRIENELTRINYQIDKLSGQNLSIDRLSSYPTINIDIVEVLDYTIMEPVKTPFSEKISNTLKSSFRDMGYTIQSMFLWLISTIPALLILIPIVAVLCFVAARRRARRRRLIKQNEQQSADDLNKSFNKD